MSAQSDDEFAVDPRAPRVQPGPGERQSHGGSSPPQPHRSSSSFSGQPYSSSSVEVSRQGPEAMHVGIRPQGMPGFHPTASSASYYDPGTVFAGGAASSAAPPPGAVPVPRHSYLFKTRAPLGFTGVVQQLQMQHFVQQQQQQQFLPQQGGAPRQQRSAGLPIALDTETGSAPASSSPPPVIGGKGSPLVVISSPGAGGSTAAGGVPEADGGVYTASSPPPGGIIVGKTVLVATPEKGDPNAKPLYLAQHARTPTKVRRETDNPPNYPDHHVGPLRNEIIRRARMDRVRDRGEGKDTTLRIAPGSGTQGLFTKASTAKKEALVAALESRDKYLEDDLGEQPEWRTMKATTPEGARKKRERETVAASSSAAKDSTPKFMKDDQVRLAIIMMADTMLEKTLASEQSPESVADFTHQKGAGKDVYREAARAFMESSTNVELPAEISIANGDPAELVEKWESIDAKAPAAKYSALWTAAAKDTAGAEGAMAGSDGKGGGSSGSDRGGASNDSKQTPKDAELVKPEDVGATLMHKQWKNIKRNYRVKTEEEDKTGGGGTQQDDDDNDDEDGSDDSTGGGGGRDDSNSHAWTYWEGKVVNYVVHLLIENGGGFVGDMKDYFSTTLDDDMCLETLAIDVDSDSGMDSMDEAFGGRGGVAGENRAEAARKKQKSRDSRASREDESDSKFLKGMQDLLKASGPKQSLDKLGKTLASLKLMLKEARDDNEDAETIELYENAIKKAKKDFKEAINA